ncbi:MAG: hypothetical protein RLZZ137_1057 [Cyanobacteriota bacterium]|jgi:hypothetical protein
MGGGSCPMVVYGMVLYRSHHHPTAETLPPPGDDRPACLQEHAQLEAFRQPWHGLSIAPPRQIDLLALMIANGQQDLWMLLAFVGAMSALLRQRC